MILLPILMAASVNMQILMVYEYDPVSIDRLELTVDLVTDYPILPPRDEDKPITICKEEEPNGTPKETCDMLGVRRRG